MKLIEAIEKTFGLRENQYESRNVSSPTITYNQKSHMLQFKATVKSFDGSTSYQIALTFKGINWNYTRTKEFNMQFTLPSGELVYLNRPNKNTHIMTRCSCPDYRFMWMWYNKPPKALIGPAIPYTRVPGSNRPPRNPGEVPGLCKHLLALVKRLISLRVIRTDPDLLRYLNRVKKEIK